jgi:NB-ARC domain
MGGVGKTTACRILANDTQVRQRFHEGVFWIAFGQDSTAVTVIEQLVHVAELSGGRRTAASISEASTNRFEQAKSYFQRWFENRAVLFVVDDTWPSEDPAFEKWVEVIRGVPGRCSVVLHSSRCPLRKMNVAFVQLDEEEQRLYFGGTCV